jgi:hypothetical protein
VLASREGGGRRKPGGYGDDSPSLHYTAAYCYALCVPRARLRAKKRRGLRAKKRREAKGLLAASGASSY